MYIKKIFAKMKNGFPWWLRGKESACNAGDPGSIPGSGRFPGGGHSQGNPLQYSCLENPHGQRSLAGCSPQGCTEATKQQPQEEEYIKLLQGTYVHLWLIHVDVDRKQKFCKAIIFHLKNEYIYLKKWLLHCPRLNNVSMA